MLLLLFGNLIRKWWAWRRIKRGWTKGGWRDSVPMPPGSCFLPLKLSVVWSIDGHLGHSGGMEQFGINRFWPGRKNISGSTRCKKARCEKIKVPISFTVSTFHKSKCRFCTSKNEFCNKGKEVWMPIRSKDQQKAVPKASSFQFVDYTQKF